MNLRSTVKNIQDIMRKDDGIDGDAQRLGQLTWMLFLNVFDQREDEWEDDAKEDGKTTFRQFPISSAGETEPPLKSITNARNSHKCKVAN